jgi:hypothetical protein
MFLTGSIRFPPPSSRVLKNSTHSVQVSCILLSKDLYLRNTLPQWFPGDPWLHFYNAYFEMYLFFNQRNNISLK